MALNSSRSYGGEAAAESVLLLPASHAVKEAAPSEALHAAAFGSSYVMLATVCLHATVPDELLNVIATRMRGHL